MRWRFKSKQEKEDALEKWHSKFLWLTQQVSSYWVWMERVERRAQFGTYSSDFKWLYRFPANTDLR